MRFTGMALALQLLLACDTTPTAITINEELSTTITCNLPTESTCTNWGKFLIPTNLNLEGRPIKAIEIDTILLRINYDSMLSFFQFRKMFLSFRSEEHSETILFTTALSPPTLETALLSGEPVSIGLTEEQHEIIRALLESEKSVLILIAVAAYGQASSVQINLSTSAMIHY